MECVECKKQLNDMTVICDRCGALLSTEKAKVKDSEFMKQIIPREFNNIYPNNLKEVIRNAFHFHNIKNDYKGIKRKYVDNYIEYALLRVYYENNKHYFLTKEFPMKSSYEVYKTWVDKKMSKGIGKILEEAFKDDYNNKQIPSSMIKNIDLIYIHQFDLKKITKSKLVTNLTFKVLKEIVKTTLIVTAALAGLYYGLENYSDIELLSDFEYKVESIGLISVVVGSLIGFKKSKYFSFSTVINCDKEFKKHIEATAPKKFKTIKYRIKKGG